MRWGRLVVVVGVLLVSIYASNATRLRAMATVRTPTLSFSGHRWTVKSSSAPMGPGPNLFSGANTSVDASGNLHLHIDKAATDQWRSAELVNTRSLGYGTYRWTVVSDPTALDPNVVLGLFTWSDLAAFNHREIDIEWARWGNAADPTNAQFVVQPFGTNGNLHRFVAPAGGPTVFEFTWSIDRVSYRLRRGTTVIDSWNYSGADIPMPGGERAHMNLWLLDGKGPTDAKPAEIVLSDFDFCTPAGMCA